MEYLLGVPLGVMHYCEPALGVMGRLQSIAVPPGNDGTYLEIGRLHHGCEVLAYTYLQEITACFLWNISLGHWNDITCLFLITCLPRPLGTICYIIISAGMHVAAAKDTCEQSFAR